MLDHNSKNFRGKASAMGGEQYGRRNSPDGWLPHQPVFQPDLYAERRDETAGI